MAPVADRRVGKGVEFGEDGVGVGRAGLLEHLVGLP
jgi:hypothetical protein